jgi:prepilin-type N-terminal cleavage/methylation domain-containing protein
MRKSTSGFTIVELLVVITIIGILTTIMILSFSRYQMNTRDTERASKATILAEALEKYYDKSGEYPGCLAVNGADTGTISKNVLLGVEPRTYLTPTSVVGNTNSVECMDITNTTSDPDVFAYVGDGSAACTSGPSCLAWTLKYKEETTGTIKRIQSRRNTNIATSGAPTLSVNADSFTQITTSWTGVDNALSYEVQWATNSSFTTGQGTQTVTPKTLAITGLTFDTLYYFRVRAIAATSQGVWSNVANTRTWGLAAPSTTAVATSTSTFTSSWGAVAHAASYNVQCSSDGSTWSGCTGSTTGLSYNWGPTWQGKPLYFRTQAVNGPYLSAWSNTAGATTGIDNPAPYGLASDNTLPNWNYLYGRSDAGCPAGTTPSYDWYANGGFWVSGTQYHEVNYGLSWNTSVTLSVASRCTTAYTSSGFVWANNTASMDLPWPTVSTWLPGDSNMYWSGTCPKWSTSNNFYWRTNGRLAASGNTWQSAYSSPPTWYTGWSWWGNGNAHVTLSCDGPWGTASIETTSMYGPGCVPTPTVPECYQ